MQACAQNKCKLHKSKAQTYWVNINVQSVLLWIRSIHTNDSISQLGVSQVEVGE